MQGSIVPAIMGKIIFIFLLSIVACLLEKDPLHYDVHFDFSPFTAFGVALSLFLGFRNNACYDRWWEARKQWGKQIITVRNLGRIMNTIAPDHSTTRRILNYASAHSHALRNQLRKEEGDNSIEDRNSFLSKEEIKLMSGCPNPADKILYFANGALRDLLLASHRYVTRPSSEKTESDNDVEKWEITTATSTTRSTDKEPVTTGSGIFPREPIVILDTVMFAEAHKHITELGWVQGACERIENTPVPFPYALLVHRTACFYCLLAPFAMVNSCGWFTPPLMAIIAYVFFGLDELSHHLGHPFSSDQQSLSLTAMCRVIDISTRMAIGEPPPEPLQPVDTVLM